MNVDALVKAGKRTNPRKGCKVCALTGDPAKVIARLEDLIREYSRDAVSASALAKEDEWQEATGIGVYPLRDHFRECLPRAQS